jgi:hypothetical protein
MGFGIETARPRKTKRNVEVVCDFGCQRILKDPFQSFLQDLSCIIQIVIVHLSYQDTDHRGLSIPPLDIDLPGEQGQCGSDLPDKSVRVDVARLLDVFPTPKVGPMIMRKI